MKCSGEYLGARQKDQEWRNLNSSHCGSVSFKIYWGFNVNFSRVHQNFFIYTSKHYIKQCFEGEVFTALNIWIVVLWVMKPFSLMIMNISDKPPAYIFRVDVEIPQEHW